MSCWIIFAILILVHGFEAIVLRSSFLRAAFLLFWKKTEKNKLADG